MNLKQLETNLINIKKYSPEIYKDTMNLSIPFFILHNKLYKTGNEVILKEFDLNQSELDILVTLYYISDGSFTMSPTKLYDVMLFSSGGITKILKKLELKKHIIRLNNENDKRGKLVQLTSLGKETISKALKDIVAFEDNSFKKLEKTEQEEFKRLLYKIIN